MILDKNVLLLSFYVCFKQFINKVLKITPHFTKAVVNPAVGGVNINVQTQNTIPQS